MDAPAPVLHTHTHVHTHKRLLLTPCTPAGACTLLASAWQSHFTLRTRGPSFHRTQGTCWRSWPFLDTLSHTMPTPVATVFLDTLNTLKTRTARARSDTASTTFPIAFFVRHSSSLFSLFTTLHTADRRLTHHQRTPDGCDHHLRLILERTHILSLDARFP